MIRHLVTLVWRQPSNLRWSRVTAVEEDALTLGVAVQVQIHQNLVLKALHVLFEHHHLGSDEGIQDLGTPSPIHVHSTEADP